VLPASREKAIPANRVGFARRPALTAASEERMGEGLEEMGMGLSPAAARGGGKRGETFFWYYVVCSSCRTHDAHVMTKEQVQYNISH
jgi:hypothetical protein